MKMVSILSYDTFNTLHALMASSTSCFLLKIPMWCFSSLGWGTPLSYLPCISMSFASSYFLIQFHPCCFLSRPRCTTVLKFPSSFHVFCNFMFSLCISPPCFLFGIWGILPLSRPHPRYFRIFYLKIRVV